ncbi:endonuclease domain-containing protein [Nocardioides sp. ChNu-99]|uniref:endonuclease domain-containing protein n=1 Tax=Nocardioides sp. ChNu-99 TaxID=2839897 RepID=UPI0024064BB7|nr:endonuclease domain-containing protein [Nocardioides sp. ChNu-99]MDF9718095.1 endonuclease VII domain-containing protein [Nocardioides sp. ChNu-99]
MAKRNCAQAGCPALVEAGVRDGRCLDHRRQVDRERGSATARGYGYTHTQLSKRMRAEAIGMTCHFCKEVMVAGQDLALDHTPDRAGYRGVVHLSCNARDGALRGNAQRLR